jgi:hypothetical protein
MINNIELIKPLLNFEDNEDFYMLYIFLRKKDQKENEKNKHQSVRTIKSYCISSVKYLEEKYEEIIKLSELFKARVYIHVEKQNHKDVSLNMLLLLAENIKNGKHNHKHLFDSTVGKLKTKEKRWIIDIDSKDEILIKSIIEEINAIRPDGDKIDAIIPTKNGVHLITKRFDTAIFRKKYPNIDIQKKNPTLLYFPNSLNF